MSDTEQSESRRKFNEAAKTDAIIAAYVYLFKNGTFKSEQDMLFELVISLAEQLRFVEKHLVKFMKERNV